MSAAVEPARSAGPDRSSAPRIRLLAADGEGVGVDPRTEIRGDAQIRVSWMLRGCVCPARDSGEMVDEQINGE
jgi:hypothetical protein